MRRDRKHWARRPCDDFLGHTSQQHMTQTRPAMSRHDDEIGPLSLRHIHDTRLWRPKFNFLANVDRFYVVCKSLDQKLIQSRLFIREQVARRAKLLVAREQVFSHWDDVINNNLSELCKEWID